MDTLIIDFADSTYSAFQYNDYDRPWELKTFYNSTVLDLNGNTIVAHKLNDSIIEAYFDGDLVIKERKPKWDKKLIFGKWIEEQYLNTDPINIPPPAPPPNVNEDDYDYPPYFLITKDSIYSDFYYKKSRSKIRISSLGEFISLSLNSKFDEVDTFWKIKSLNDSVMIVNRIFKYPHDNSYHIETDWDLKLIKKR